MIMMEKVERAEREAAEVEEDEAMLPGFRFHPTDEELVGFYLRRKVQKKRLSIEIIKEMEIYKHEPWDLPNSGNVTTAGEKEWYFFCRRGRKYRNSVRPNRVTGCGFWKATGIDRPIHSSGRCIGLKKSLVYYRGHAGKGTKTDWMMHEFRLPSSSGETAAKNAASLQEAEVWTICRIFKRSGSYKKQPNSYRASAPTKSSPSPPEYSSSVTNCFDPDEYMCSGSSGGSPEAAAPELHVEDYNITAGEWSSASVGHDQPASWDQSPSSNDFAGDGFWEELGWIEQFLADDNYSLDNSNVNTQGNYTSTDHA